MRTKGADIKSKDSTFSFEALSLRCKWFVYTPHHNTLLQDRRSAAEVAMKVMGTLCESARPRRYICFGTRRSQNQAKSCPLFDPVGFGSGEMLKVSPKFILQRTKLLPRP
jgi:hypothetical protein